MDATAVPGQLINSSNPAMPGTAFTGNQCRHVTAPSRSLLTFLTLAHNLGRMIFAESRLLMLIGMGRTVLLENKNLDDPSNPADWVAAEGDGEIKIDWVLLRAPFSSTSNRFTTFLCFKLSYYASIDKLALTNKWERCVSTYC